MVAIAWRYLQTIGYRPIGLPESIDSARWTGRRRRNYVAPFDSRLFRCWIAMLVGLNRRDLLRFVLTNKLMLDWLRQYPSFHQPYSAAVRTPKHNIFLHSTPVWSMLSAHACFTPR